MVFALLVYKAYYLVGSLYYNYYFSYVSSYKLFVVLDCC
jgi:hypothetical protein